MKHDRSSTRDPDDRPERAGRWRRRAVIATWAVGMLVVALAAARLALPGIVRDYVNRVLDRSPGFDGTVGRVEMHLWRGAYAINDVSIVKTDRAVPVPFLSARRVDLAIDWNSLRHLKLRGRARIEAPRVNFVDGPTSERTQTGAGGAWLGMLHDLYPFRIDRAEVIDGQVHFRAFHKEPPVDVYLSGVDAVLENLTNASDSTKPLLASVHATGRGMRSATFEFDMELDPNSYRPRFSLAARLLGLDVRELNSLARAYGDFDFEDGEFDFVVELTARDGDVRGYAKPLFRNVTVIGLRDIGSEDPLRVLWELLVGAVGQALSNPPRDQFGTRITIRGTLDDPRTSILEIVGNVLRNAFVRAYLPRLEGRAAPDAVLSRRVKDLEKRSMR